MICECLPEKRKFVLSEEDLSHIDIYNLKFQEEETLKLVSG
jgi:hypothetical protein